MDPRKDSIENDPIMQWYEIYKHAGEKEWSEIKNIQELSEDEFYDLWEGDRI